MPNVPVAPTAAQPPTTGIRSRSAAGIAPAIMGGQEPLGGPDIEQFTRAA
jgi:hypothetical protein